MRSSTTTQLDRRAFVRLSSCGAGLLWAAPRISSVAPATAGSPAPKSPPTTSDPPEIASELAAPIELAVAPAGAAAPEVLGKVEGVRDPLAITGTEIGQMTALGIGAVASGLGLRHVAKRLEADELGRGAPEAGAPEGQPGER